ncbi:UNVERIFIED_CONTAM: hypothetical protein RMT77_001598 [Armadillidium vulgare]
MKFLSHTINCSRRYFSVTTVRNLSLSERNERNLTNEDYQVLHHSNVPTMHFQKSLLRLPIPELDKTCSRYLRSQRVILNDSEYQKTEKIVQDFGNGIGKELQALLKNLDAENKHTSYISGPWFDMYLSDRAPIVLNYNPFLALYPDERPGYNDPVIRTSNMLISSLRFMNTLKKGILKPEVYHLNPAKSDIPLFYKVTKWVPSALASYAAYAFKAFPLDMSQFKNLFHSTRIPRQGKDKIQDFPDAKHMLMMKNGNFYVFDILDKDGNIMPPSHIHACVSYIYNDKSPFPEFPVGILTSENRDVWATMRNELIQAGNEEALMLIDSAAFNIVLDDTSNVKDDPDVWYRTFLCGKGGNRWFDKSFSLIITESGVTALNFEHAWGDGVAVMRYVNEVSVDSVKNSQIHPDSIVPNIDASKLVKKIEFRIPDSVKSGIKSALTSYKEKTDSLGVNIYESEIFGKKFCKKHKVSPDAMMQLGFQLGFYLQNQTTVATYESCSTSAFRHGRTETLRPATLETLSFSKAAVQSEKNFPELKKSLYECSAMHGTLTKEAAMGNGFDRHLFGLRKMAEDCNFTTPDIFKDPSYAKMNHNVLSTSTLPSSEIRFGGFAPVVPDGFGVGYQIQDDKLGVVLSSYPPRRNGQEYLECVDKAYKIIHETLSK